MAIMVQYKDNTFGHVQNSILDELIKADRIAAFRRRDGWVEIVTGRLRANDPSATYQGTERRSVMARSCLTCPHFVSSQCVLDACSVRYFPLGKTI
jgi:hypothetical protein